MNTIRNRAKEHLPTVLLTLLSIVQALALELLWSHVREASYLFELSSIALIYWTQITASLIGVVLIWFVYVSNVVRFRWVPTTGDSVYPFIIGLLEFALVETLGPERLSLWFMFLAMIFGLMTWVGHTTMRRARLDGENDAFFARVAPAKLRDFYAAISIVGMFALLGIYLFMFPLATTKILIALLAANGVLAWQFYQSSVFWSRSVGGVA